MKKLILILSFFYFSTFCKNIYALPENDNKSSDATLIKKESEDIEKLHQRICSLEQACKEQSESLTKIQMARFIVRSVCLTVIACKTKTWWALFFL